MLKTKPGRHLCQVKLVLESGEIRYLRSRGEIAALSLKVANVCLEFANKFGYAHIENHKYSGEIFGALYVFKEDIHFVDYTINVVKQVLIEGI